MQGQMERQVTLHGPVFRKLWVVGYGSSLGGSYPSKSSSTAEGKVGIINVCHPFTVHYCPRLQSHLETLKLSI